MIPSNSALMDQATGLRAFVAEVGKADAQALRTTYRDVRGNILVDIEPEFPETFEMYQNRLAFWRVSQEMGGGDMMADKAKLWDDLKAELETLARGRNLGSNMPGVTAFGATNESHNAQWALDRMASLEDLAAVRPATAGTFARVRDELNKGGV